MKKILKILSEQKGEKKKNLNQKKKKKNVGEDLLAN